MEIHNDSAFGNKDSEAKQFRIEVALEGKGLFFYVHPLGGSRYEILNDEGSVGTIMLDQNDHARCESVGCELDLSLMHAIRQAIQNHQQWNDRA